MKLAGIYLLADESILPFTEWPELMPQLLAQKIACVQYRAKDQAPEQQYEHAMRLRSWCQAQSIPLLVNDSIELALAIQADGVHLGRDDSSIVKARRQLGSDSIIGVSCYNDLQRAKLAAANGADYVSFGRFFPSTTKPHATPARLDTLGIAKQELNSCICAIGGISSANIDQVKLAGADLICIGAGILRQQDPVTECRKLATILSSKNPA